MHGDKQLVDMWTNFLKHNHWITYDHLTSGWVLTDKGKQWIEQIKESVLPPQPPSSLVPSLQKQQQKAEVSIF
jgi:hypothetical protein